MLTLRQTPFDLFETDLFKQLEQQLHSAERVPAAEVRESEAGYSISLELPGVDRDSIDVKATDRSLVISAERRAPQAEQEQPAAEASPARPNAPLLSEFRYGTWSRSFRFPSGIEREGITAHYRDGLLTVTAPKAQTMTSVTVQVEA